MNKYIVLLGLIITISCSNTLGPKNYEILGYKDFGPQSLAENLIGTSWWQWDDHGDSYPRDYPIFVIVYRDVNLQEIKKHFPVVREKKLDYRYVEYNKTIDFLNNAIEKLKQDKDKLPKMTIETLTRTRHKINLKLGERRRNVQH